jgi:hypothetical protein
MLQHDYPSKSFLDIVDNVMLQLSEKLGELR